MTDPIAPADPDVVLRAQNVDLVRDGKLILDRISVTVRAGEHWALLGPNGAGKSTLLNIMATYAHPTRGQMDILGHRLGRVNVFSLRPWIGHITPNHRVEPARTVRQVVLTGVTGTIELPQYWVPGAAEASRAEDLIDMMGLKGLASARWRTLSQGERGRTLIARALMAEPRLLLLDEPAAGLDVAGREQLLASIDELRWPPCWSRTTWRSSRRPRRTRSCCVPGSSWPPARSSTCSPPSWSARASTIRSRSRGTPAAGRPSPGPSGRS
jgi:iron complex transport system ATP-binding protein